MGAHSVVGAEKLAKVADADSMVIKETDSVDSVDEDSTVTDEDDDEASSSS